MSDLIAHLRDELLIKNQFLVWGVTEMIKTSKENCNADLNDAVGDSDNDNETEQEMYRNRTNALACLSSIVAFGAFEHAQRGVGLNAPGGSYRGISECLLNLQAQPHASSLSQTLSWQIGLLMIMS